MTEATTRIRRLDGGATTVAIDDIEQLRGTLQGRALLPGEAGFDDATLTWNGMVAHKPALVIQPRSATDVATAIAFGRNRDLLLSVRGGGHNIAGTSIAPGGVTVDMSLRRFAEVDPEAGLARVGPGCTLADVDAATQGHGLATVLGFVSETGVAGLTLGGGWGYLTRRFGWTVDNLEEVEIVTADGEIRIANRGTNDDLFWAIRGGSGNFGIVTRFTYRLHRVGPTVTGGLYAWDADRADEVLTAYRDVTADAPRELTVAALVRHAPPAPFVPEAWHGRPIVALLACYSGDDPEAALAPIREIGDPVVRHIQELPYTAMQSLADANEPKGPHRYWKTEYLPALESGFLEAFRKGAIAMSSPLSQSVIFHLGGALNERAGDDGAVGNRDARYVSGFNGTWPAGVAGEPHIAWVRESWERIRPYSTGGNYVNFQLAEDGADRLRSAYGRNYDRLRRVKARVDPENYFRVNRNIPPAA